jgi:VanZ family protein
MVRVAVNGAGTRWLWFAAVIVLAALIFYQSSHRSIKLQDQPFKVVFGEQRSQQSDDLEDAGHVLAHLGLYGALAFGIHRGLGGRGTGAALIAVGSAVLFGVSDELHQALGDSRRGSLYDVLTNLTGALLGLAASVILSAILSEEPRRYPRRRRRKG